MPGDEMGRKEGREMFKGNVYCRRWTYQDKKRKAWGIRYTVNGKVTREIVADTREGAQAELDRKREDYQMRLVGVAEGKTLTDLAAPYREYQRAKQRDMATIEARLKNLLAFFGKIPLDTIEERAAEYVNARRKAEVTPGTINRELAVLNHMLHLAHRKFRMLRHGVVIERLDDEAGPRDRELTRAEEASLLPACPQDLRDLIEAGLMTGMREGELIGIRRAQVDLDARVITFAPTKKGLKRLMPINERLYYLLARRCAGLSPDALVFSLAGRPWERWHIRNRLSRAITRAEIPALRFHDLRHTAASRLRRAGADLDHIRKVLGHQGIQTTHGYVHYEAEQLRPILALLSTPQVSTREAQEDLAFAGQSATMAD